MTRRTLPLLALALTATATTGAAPAHATPPTGHGRTCGMSTTDDGSGTTQTGTTDAGPVTAVDGPAHPTGNPGYAQIRCTVQVNAPLHSGPDGTAWVASGTPTAQVAGLQVVYPATISDTVYLCTRWELSDATGEGIDVYWDAPSGTWTADPAVAGCALAVRLGASVVVAAAYETAP